MTLGAGEFLLIGFILVVVFSAARMGALGNAVGKFVYSFRKASKGEDLIDARRAGDKLSARKPAQPPEDAELDEPPRRS